MLHDMLTRTALACASIAVAVLAQAQGYPAQTVRVVVGFPPGGTTDVIGRLVAQSLQEQLGKPFVVENRGGASGTIAAGQVAKSAPDGHTLILVPSTHGTARSLYSSLPYEEGDFAPVALVASTPYVFVAHPSLPVKGFGELVKKMAGVDMVHVAYKGTGAVMPDLLSGRIPMMFENLAVMTPHIRKGSLLPLAVSSKARTPLMPEVPTVGEAGMGLETFEVLGWFALLAPARTPAEALRLLNGEVNRMIAKPAMVTRFAELGAEPLGGTPERASAFIRGEQEKWGRVIREVGIQIQ